MKRFSFFLFAMLLAITGHAGAIMDNPTNANNINIPIKGESDMGTSTPKPLSLRSDIEASYYNGALTIVFNADLGDADIVVSNLVTGDMWSDSVLGVGATKLLLSGDEGYYEIRVYTDCGNYSGEFEI